ncbi:hypothetical protein Sjap_026617 [Stephania japonica]|uniref:Uncharacterized protein n=1 Tax=Stephania japonica TaxID=461633 RepID=A0AAP0DXU2_9MAGN
MPSEAQGRIEELSVKRSGKERRRGCAPSAPSVRVRLAPLERLGGTCPPISCGKRGGLRQAMVAPGGSGTGSSRGGSYRSPASRWGANPEQPWPDFGPPRLLPEIAQNRGSTSDIMENLLSTPPVGARIEESKLDLIQQMENAVKEGAVIKSTMSI